MRIVPDLSYDINSPRNRAVILTIPFDLTIDLSVQYRYVLNLGETNIIKNIEMDACILKGSEEQTIIIKGIEIDTDILNGIEEQTIIISSI